MEVLDGPLGVHELVFGYLMGWQMPWVRPFDPLADAPVLNYQSLNYSQGAHQKAVVDGLANAEKQKAKT